MTIRQVWVRLRSLTYDSPLMGALRLAAEVEVEQKRSEDLNDALTRYRPREG